MTDKQKLFAQFYIGEAGGSAIQAAIMAGYSEAYANANSYKLLRQQNIVDYINFLRKKTGLAEREIKEINAKIASIADIQEFWTKVMQDEDEQMKNRLRASELIAKCKGMFNNDW